MMLQRAESILRVDRVVRTSGFGCATPWFFGLVLTGLVSAVLPASAQSATNETPIEFYIPVQPLVSALRLYGDTTGREAIYKANLATGRIAGHVQGVLTPTEALDRLLAGTGLSARFVADGAFVLSAPPPAVRTAITPTQSSAHRRYYALIQESLLDSLCQHGSARPGRYRMIAVFWIAPSGAVEDALRVGTTGTVDVDQQIDAMLRGMRFSEPPPAGFAQPVRIMIVPHTQGVTPACAGADARPRANRGGR